MFLRELAKNARRRPQRDAARWRHGRRLVLLLVGAYGYEHAAEVLEDLAAETRAAVKDVSTAPDN